VDKEGAAEYYIGIAQQWSVKRIGRMSVFFTLPAERISFIGTT